MSHRVIMVDPALAAAPQAVREEARRRFERSPKG